MLSAKSSPVVDRYLLESINARLIVPEAIRRMQSFPSFEKGEEFGWWEVLYHVANDTKHVRLVPQSVQSKTERSSGWIDERSVSIMIDYSEPLPQLTNWSFFLFAQKRASQLDKTQLADVSKLLCIVLLKAQPRTFAIQHKGKIPFTIPTRAIRDRWNKEGGKEVILKELIQQLDGTHSSVYSEKSEEFRMLRQSVAKTMECSKLEWDVKDKLGKFIDTRIGRLSSSDANWEPDFSSDLESLFEVALGSGPKSIEKLLQDLSIPTADSPSLQNNSLRPPIRPQALGGVENHFLELYKKTLPSGDRTEVYERCRE